MSSPAAGTQDTQTIRPCQTFEGHTTNSVNDIIHMPGGHQIMTCSGDGSLRVWNLDSGEQIGKDWRDGKSGIYAMALSPDEKKVACGSADGAVTLWDIATGKLSAKWSGHRELVTSLCWNKDGGRVVSGSQDDEARVWDVKSGETILPIKTGLAYVQAVIYSPDATMIATGGGNEEKECIKIWDARSGKLVINLKGHNGETVYCLAWSTDGGMLISGSADKTIRTWNTTTWQETAVLRGHTGDVYAVAMSPNGRILASAGDNTVRLWNLDNSEPIGSPLKDVGAMNHAVSFSADGKILATGFRGRNACTWDISVIIRAADQLNPNGGDKSLLDVDAPRRKGRRLENVHRVPPGFFDDSPHSSAGRSRPPPSSPLRQYYTPERTLLGRISSLFRLTDHDTHAAPHQPRSLQWARNRLSGTSRRRNDERVGLEERRPTVVDVPFTKGKRRNISGAEIRLEREKARKAKKASAGSSRTPQSSIGQQSGGVPQAQPSSSELHAALPTSSATPVATTSTSSRPDVTITQAGCWTRFWLILCCVSAQYTDGRH